MKRLLMLLLAGSLHAAGPVHCAFDAKVVDWNNRCITNNINVKDNLLRSNVSLNKTISLIASSAWMGGIRAAGLYPGNILRANLMCGGSYGDGSGAGSATNNTANSYNIGSPQIPLINDAGGLRDECLSLANIDSVQAYWKYTETGSGGGLGCVSTNHPVMFNTGMNMTTTSIGQNDVHLAGYLMGNQVLNGGAFIGLVKNGVDYMLLTSDGSVAATTFWSAAGLPVVTTGDTGFFLGTRTSSAATGVALFKNNTLLGRSTSVGGTLANLTFLVCIYGYNAGSGPMIASSFSSQLAGGYTIGLGISDSVATNAYYNTWQQFETLLGRQK